MSLLITQGLGVQGSAGEPSADGARYRPAYGPLVPTAIVHTCRAGEQPQIRAVLQAVQVNGEGSVRFTQSIPPAVTVTDPLGDLVGGYPGQAVFDAYGGAQIGVESTPDTEGWAIGRYTFRFLCWYRLDDGEDASIPLKAYLEVR